MTDYYLENPKALNGQPKQTIGDYVESNGILVPRRFDSLAEARKSHRPIFLRSEHPQEYDGASGLLDSFRLSARIHNTGKGELCFSPRGMTSIEDITEGYFDIEDKGAGSPVYLQYCILKRIEPEEFKSETSFSLWERLNGVKRTIVADSAIRGKYHITSSFFSEGRFPVANYLIFENGEIQQEHGLPLKDYLKETLPALVKAYEDVRSLPRFDPNHCSLMEFITVGDKHYFVQYHRTRDFDPSSFLLERKPINGEVEAKLVRGATPSEGIIVDTTLVDYDWNRDDGWKCNELPVDEEGSFDISYFHVKPELLVRKRKFV